MCRQSKTFRATHTKHNGFLESNSHNIPQTHGKRILGRMHNKETSKIYYTEPLLRSGWIRAGIETGKDDCAKKRNTVMDPWQSYDRANHCPTDKVMYTRKCTAHELTCASGYRAAWVNAIGLGNTREEHYTFHCRYACCWIEWHECRRERCTTRVPECNTEQIARLIKLTTTSGA